MLKILLVCNAGMSTSIMAKKMEEEGKGDVSVNAVGVSEYVEHAPNADVLLVGPQIRFQADEIKKNVEIPVMVMNFQKYGMMDAKGILNDVYQEIKTI